MIRDSRCLYSTPIDIPETLRSLPQKPSDARLSYALTHVAQEASGQLQRFYPADRSNNPVKTIAIREIEPEYKFIITIEPLTDRELEVLQLIVEGHSNIAIAETLYISVGTVKTHVRNVLRKLCASDRTQAAIRALRSGLVH